MVDEERMHELLEKFWTDYSKLVARYMGKVPATEQDLFLVRLQEKSNAFSCAYADYMKGM